MRKYLLAAWMSLVLMSCKDKAPRGANGVSFQSALDYNEYIVDRQTSLMQDLVEFVRVTQTNLDSGEVLLNKSVRTTEQMIRELKGMPPYKGDSAFRDAAASAFGFYREIFDKDYRQVIQIRKRADGFTPTADMEIAAIVAKIKRQEKDYDSRFKETQNEFARKNDILLTTNKKQQDLKDQLKTK
jgi:hypothetical protein